MNQIVLSKPIKRTITAILLLATFLSLASQTLMITALATISSTFHVSLTAGQWLTTGYTLIIGVVTPLSSNLYEKFSSRRVFLSIIAIFLLGGCIGATAPNFLLILLGRLIQAIASGLLMSFTMTTLISINPPEKRGTVLGSSALVIAAGPAIGPTLAGIVLNYLSWRYLFLLFIPFFVVIWLIGFKILPNYSPMRQLKIDWLSVILSLCGTSAALASLTVIRSNVISGLVLLVAGLIICAYFSRRQLRLEHPMLNVAILAQPAFLLMTFVAMLAFMILLGTEQIIPLFTERVLHVSTMASGMILLPGAVINAVFAAIAGRIYDSHGPVAIVYSGFALIAVASVPLLFLNTSIPIWLIVLAYFLRMWGNACIFGPVTSEAFRLVAKSQISHATALINTLRQFSGAVAVTIVIVISEIPAVYTVGVNWAIWSTIGLAVIGLVIFTYYLHKYNVTK